MFILLLIVIATQCGAQEGFIESEQYLHEWEQRSTHKDVPCEIDQSLIDEYRSTLTDSIVVGYKYITDSEVRDGSLYETYYVIDFQTFGYDTDSVMGSHGVWMHKIPIYSKPEPLLIEFEAWLIERNQWVKKL